MSEKHVIPVGTYVGIFTALIALTGLTVWVAFHDFGSMNTVIAVGIACVKALLVALFFMHLKYSARILWLYAGTAIAFFILLITITLSDYRSREWFPTPKAWSQPTATAPGASH